VNQEETSMRMMRCVAVVASLFVGVAGAAEPAPAGAKASPALVEALEEPRKLSDAEVAQLLGVAKQNMAITPAQLEANSEPYRGVALRVRGRLVDLELIEGETHARLVLGDGRGELSVFGSFETRFKENDLVEVIGVVDSDWTSPSDPNLRLPSLRLARMVKPGGLDRLAPRKK
jgi:hypothetical protein